MPVHDLGYRSWVGQRMSRLLRPLIVAQGGVALVWRKKWLRMMLIFSWMPIIVFGLGVFFYEFSLSNSVSPRGIAMAMTGFPIERPDLAAKVLADPEGSRHDVWSMMILTFFRAPQLVAMVLLVGLIAPMMISYDLRSKAYLMYFSRPLSPGQYILGKSAVLWFFLSMITALPALALYVVAIFMSPDLSVIGDTWDIPLRIIAATIVLVVPTTALALCYSSFTSESRYASFCWFATWTMGFVAYNILTFAGSRMGPRPRRRRRPRFGDVEPEQAEQATQVATAEAIDPQIEFLAQRDFGPRDIPQPPSPPSGGFGGAPPRGRGRGRDWSVEDFEQFANDQEQMLGNVDLDQWRMVSPFHTLGKVQDWIFGLDSTDGSVMPSVVLLSVGTIVCVLLIRNRIIARLRI